MLEAGVNPPSPGYAPWLDMVPENGARQMPVILLVAAGEPPAAVVYTNVNKMPGRQALARATVIGAANRAALGRMVTSAIPPRFPAERD